MSKQQSGTVRLRVTAPEGRYIVGHGSRECGGVFELPAQLARQLLIDQPENFEEASKAPGLRAGRIEPEESDE